MVKDDSNTSNQDQNKLGLNRKAVFFPMMLILTISLLGSFVFSLYVLPDEFNSGYVYIVLWGVIGSSFLLIKFIPTNWLDRKVKTFLDLDNVQKFTYGRFMACLGELFIAASIIAIAIGFSSTMNMPGLRMVALFTVLLVVLMVTFSIVSLLLQCFPHGSRKYLIYQMAAGLFLLIVSQAIINFGIYSGKGVSDFYASKDQVQEKKI